AQCHAPRSELANVTTPFRSTPILIGNFESCFKQHDESTVNAGVSNHPHNMSLSTGCIAKWAFAGFGEGVLTVAIESAQRSSCASRRPIASGWGDFGPFIVTGAHL